MPCEHALLASVLSSLRLHQLATASTRCNVSNSIDGPHLHGPRRLHQSVHPHLRRQNVHRPHRRNGRHHLRRTNVHHRRTSVPHHSSVMLGSHRSFPRASSCRKTGCARSAAAYQAADAILRRSHSCHRTIVRHRKSLRHTGVQPRKTRSFAPLNSEQCGSSNCLRCCHGMSTNSLLGRSGCSRAA